MNATAAVFREPNTRLELTSVPLPQLRNGEVIVEVDCCTLCGSDLHTISGVRRVPVPTILGHEIAGHIVDIRGTVSDINDEPVGIGDRIRMTLSDEPLTLLGLKRRSDGPPAALALK